MNTLITLKAYFTDSPQLEITGASYDKGPSAESRLEEGGAAAEFPTQDEEESMARFWAMEEANARGGWEDDQELDYEEMAKKAAVSMKKIRTSHESPGK